MDEVFADPQVAHLAMTAPVEHRALGRLELVRNAVPMSGVGASVRTPTPEAGEHADEVLASSGSRPPRSRTCARAAWCSRLVARPCRPRSVTPQSPWRSRRSCSARARRDAFSCWGCCPRWSRTSTSSSANTAALHDSLCAAALLAGALVWVGLPRGSPFSRRRAFAYLFLAAASHGLLDTFTDGGAGVALLAPFDWTRFHAPFRPIAVSPIGAQRFFSARGLAVIASELVWLGIPCALLVLFAHIRRRPR